MTLRWLSDPGGLDVGDRFVILRNAGTPAQVVLSGVVTQQSTDYLWFRANVDGERSDSRPVPAGPQDRIYVTSDVIVRANARKLAQKLSRQDVPLPAARTADALERLEAAVSELVWVLRGR